MKPVKMWAVCDSDGEIRSIASMDQDYSKAHFCQMNHFSCIMGHIAWENVWPAFEDEGYKCLPVTVTVESEGD